MENSPGNSSDCDGSRYIGPAASNTFQYLQKSKEGEADRWSPSLFQLIPPEDNYSNVEKSDLYKNIRLAGGSNYPGREMDRDIPGVMRILNEDYYRDNEEEDILIPLDTYSSAFIYRCISNKNAGLPPPHPWIYLIPGETSKYGSKYDARKILREELDWDRINNRFVFPPNDKRVTARQWIEKLRRMEAELDSETAAAAVQNEDQTSSGDRIQNATPTTNTTVASPVVNLTDPVPSTSRGPSTSSSQNLRRRIVVESDSDEDDLFEPYAATKCRIRKTARRLTPSSSSSQNSEDFTMSGQVDPTAFSRRLTRLTRTKNLKRLGLSRRKTTTSKSFVESSPKQLRKGKGKTATFSEGENETVASSNSKKPSQTSPSKSTVSKDSEESSRPQAATVSAPSSSKKATRNPPTTPANKVVTVAGTRKSSRRGSKLQSPPASDNGSMSSDRSSDESVHFSESEDSDANEKVNVKREWRLYSTEDGQRLLDLVITHEAYRYVNGNRFWHLVAESDKSDGRTCQSMRNHFLKTVKPKVFSRRTRNIYKISPENLAKWKEANKDQYQKYFRICPDYEI